MLEAFLYGFLAGAFVIGVLAAYGHLAYQRVLLMKVKDRSCECIGGEFFYLVPESEYVDKFVCDRHEQP